MRVVALKPRFYGGNYRKVGAIFDMDESKFKKDKDGKPVLPKGVQEVRNEGEAKQAAKAAKDAEDKKQVAGAIAASGGAAAKAKTEAGRDLAG